MYIYVEATFDFVKATFDFVDRIVRLVAFHNVASTLLPVWTGLYSVFLFYFFLIFSFLGRGLD